jgi:DNA repair ATPase RecN
VAVATTIGRVEFIVGLDGNQLPGQARRLANQMEAAGKKAGDGFADGFDSTFDQRLSKIGSRFANSLSEKGKLAGTSFSNDFENVLQTRFRRMQQNLADILADKDAFIDYARGFSTVGEAVEQLNDDLDRLRGQTYINDEGKERLVLTAQAARNFGVEINRLGREADEYLTKQRELDDQTRDFEANWARLTRVLGDGDAFRQVALRVGGTGEAFNRLRSELEGVGDALGKSRIEVEGYVDALERTRDAADRANERMHAIEGGATSMERAFTRLSRAVRSPWRNLDNDVRLVLGLIIGAADQIGTLGSAIGAGLLGVGSAGASAVVGVAGLVSVFSTLNKEVDDLPPALRDVRLEAARFSDAFQRAGEVISRGAFGEMNGALDSLSGTLRRLDPELAGVGRATGRLFANLADGLEEGTDGFEELRKLLRNSENDIDRLGDVTGTWGLALLRAFNRANPLAQDLFNWLERVGDQFDSFGQSNEFDRWLSRSRDVFASLGGLLDTVSRGLNDLVTPEAVGRTTELLDNLTEFTPALIGVLDVVGRLDPLGLLAEALSAAGEAIGPLLPSLGELADALNPLLEAAITGIADGLGIVAQVAKPAVEGLTGLLEAMPPGAISAAALGLVAVGTALLSIKAAAGLSGAAGALIDFTTRANTAATASGRLVGLVGKAGLAGAFLAISLSMPGLIKGMTDYLDEISGIDAATQKAVKSQDSFLDALNTVNPNLDFTAESVRTLTDALGEADGESNNFNRALEGFGPTATTAEYAIAQLERGLGALDEQFATLTIDEQTARFSAWADQLQLTDEQVLTMIEEMPLFKAALEEAASAADGNATSQEILALAMGEVTVGAGGALTAVTNLGGGATVTAEQLDGLADSLSTSNSLFFESRDGAREYEAALDTLQDSIAENTATLDIGTEAGRLNEEAIDRLAQSALDYAGDLVRTTGDQNLANDAIKRGRDDLINLLDEFGITGKAAEDYANKLGLIPTNIWTTIEMLGIDAALDEARRLRETVLSIPTRRSVEVFVTSGGWNPNGDRPMASGGTLYGPTRILAGEAGPEAIVPLNRPLSQVDPSVRALSAFAQGLRPMASGGVVGGGKQIVIEAGAIVVEDRSGDPRRTGNEVFRRLIEDVAS